MTSHHEAIPLAEGPETPPATAEPWLLLVVDDDDEVHAVTRLALGDTLFLGRPVRILSAHTASAARQMLQRHPGIALILLDVVMETEHAGLDLARYVREELGILTTRIVLRTGQPGQAPPREVIRDYQIDDYRTKTELTFDRLYVVVLTALRTYSLLLEMAQHQKELAQSNQELERFAYVAAHDLQTPLRGIISFAQILERRFAEPLGKEGAELLSMVINSAHSMRALISDLLDFSRIGHSPEIVGEVDLNEVLRRVVKKLDSQIDKRGAVVECGELPTIQGNLTQLEQLFTNLIDNGLKFQPGSRPEVRISAAPKPGGWEIRVADKGIGIRAEHLEEIFDVFRRLHSSDEFPGTGIGLAICKKVAQAHGGSIHAESKPGGGTTMVLTLPAARKPP